MMGYSADRLQGKVWEYECEYIPDEDDERYDVLSKRERDGWEVLNITGNSVGSDVIWFKRKITKPLPKPRSPKCAHGVGFGVDGTSKCIYCGPPI